MDVFYRINGRNVSPEEWAEHNARRQSLYGNLLDEMLQSRQAPIMANSDRAFMEGAFAQTPTHGLDPISAERTLARARKAGINTHGKVYVAQLGTAENPLAWVSGIDDVKKSCELQGHGCEALGLKPVIKDPKPAVPLADHIIEELAGERIQKDPDLKAKCRENPQKLMELREEIIEKHGNPN